LKWVLSGTNKGKGDDLKFLFPVLYQISWVQNEVGLIDIALIFYLTLHFHFPDVPWLNDLHLHSTPP
jgi:hypothetical protein